MPRPINGQFLPLGVIVAVVLSGSAIAQTPVGGLIDQLRQKRLLIVLAAILVSVGCTGIALFPAFPIVIASQVLIGVAAAVFSPAIAAPTLGLVGHNRLDRRVGRNESFNHAGNVIAAVLAGLIVQFVARRATSPLKLFRKRCTQRYIFFLSS